MSKINDPKNSLACMKKIRAFNEEFNKQKIAVDPKFDEAFKKLDWTKIKGSLDRQAGRTFTVLLRRYGNSDDHSYLCGTFSTYQKACYEAKCCMAWRSGKYDAEIYESYLDSGQIKLYRIIHWGDFDATKYGY